MKSYLHSVFFGLATFAIGASVAPLHGGLILALTQNSQLLQFDSTTPALNAGPISITGIGAGFRLVGIDVRPATNQVYGLAVSSNSAINRLYTLDRNTGAASLAGTLSAPLAGNSFGMDFNPVADRLRLVSDTGQNYRINVANGETFTDTNLSFAATDRNAGTTPTLVASAYTNSFAGATSTALYGIDLATQSLVLQSPPNAGTLTTVGSLNAIAFPEASFDIDPLTNQGFAVLNGLEFSTINLSTGLATYVGDINSGSNIIGITSISAVPEPASFLLLGIAGTFMVVRGWNRKRSLLNSENSENASKSIELT